MRLVGAHSDARPEGLDRAPGRANYFGAGGARASYELYRRVMSRGVYPGIDMVFHGSQGRL
jgi:hypothetical protein